MYILRLIWSTLCWCRKL